ncbi:hypothetical protein IPF37_00855 [bacterium]|nr:MAG: hypothetical protein IPF37_00855 [bacterium]
MQLKKKQTKQLIKKIFKTFLLISKKTLAANQQATDSSEPSDSSSGQPANDPVYDELEKAWTALVSAQGNMFALAKAEPALRKLMEKNAQDANTEPLKKFIKAHFNENKAFFNLLKGQLKTIVTEAKP